MMKCPHCGSEIPEGAQCKTCGMEIHYKDFKGSEMLDIRIPSPSPGQRKKGKQESSSVEGKEHAAPGKPPAEKSGPSKPGLFLFAAILIIIAAIVWYYFLTYLLKF